MDSPVGVGFSYSKDPAKYTTGDHQTAFDTHTFLLKVNIFICVCVKEKGKYMRVYISLCSIARKWKSNSTSIFCFLADQNELVHIYG